MADLSGNPWNFLPADVSTSIAITSIIRNGTGSATVNATAHGHSDNDYISIQGASPAGWNRGYRIESHTTNSFLVKISEPQSLLANAGAAGDVLTLIYPGLIEVTQMLWDGPTAADTLLLTDATGRLVWNPLAITGGPATYMKCFPIFGLVINTFPSGKLQISV